MKRITLLLSVLLVVILGKSQSPISTFIYNDLHRNANISLLVKDLQNGKTLYSHRANNPTIPASTMKLVTTATALEMLGADYQFKTTLEVDGTISSDSILNGNLIIYGTETLRLVQLSWGISIFECVAFGS